MGYYGLGPGMKVPDQLSPFEKALRMIPTENAAITLEIIEKLMKNVAQNPKEEKFRKIRLTNATISAKITSITAAIECLLHIGWELDSDNESLVLPADKKITFPDHVTKIIDAQDFHRKENEKLRVAKGLSRVAPAGEKPVDPREEAAIATAAEKGLAWVREVKAIRVCA
jgi:hypothetical protein